MESVTAAGDPYATVTVFDGNGVLLERVELPERAPGEVDVAISAAAICGSDLHTVLGHRPAPPQVVLGHEGVGHILAADDDAVDLRGRSLTVGDRIVFGLSSSCGRCDRCTAGLTMKCRSLVKYGHEAVTTPPYASGTLATRLRLRPDTAILPVPAGLSDTQVVSAGCAAATAAAVIKAAGPLTPDAPALVFGAGAVGMYCVAMLATAGHPVYVHDPVPGRVRAAEYVGARTYSADDDREFPLIVEASGNARAFTEALRLVDIGGRVVAAGSVSPGSSTVTFDPAIVVTGRVTLVGVHNYSAEDFRFAVDWLATHAQRLGLERFTSPPYALSDIKDAFAQMGEGTFHRVLVRPEQLGPRV